MRIHRFSPLQIGRLAATSTAMPSFAFVVFLSALFVGSFAQAVKGIQPPYDLANRDTRAVRKGRFDGKVCLVTGGTSGLGADAAVHLAAEGCKTVLTGRRAAMGDRVVKLITDAGGEATFVQADVSKEEDCKKMVDTTVAKYGKLDAAFNNAGIPGKSGVPLHEKTVESFQSVMAVNVVGVFLSMKYEIPAMMKAGGGSIVNCASIYGHNGGLGISDYATSKHALTGLTKSAAAEYGALNIRVNNINPWLLEVGNGRRGFGRPSSHRADGPLPPRQPLGQARGDLERSGCVGRVRLQQYHAIVIAARWRPARSCDL